MTMRQSTQSGDPFAMYNNPAMLLAAGFNGLSQLSTTQSGGYIRSFSQVLSQPGKILFAGLGTTVLVVGDRLVGLGVQQFNAAINKELADTLREGFGDANAMKGCLTTTRELYLMNSDDGLLQLRSNDSAPLVSGIALAGNEKLALLWRRSAADADSRSDRCEMLQFKSFEDFVECLSGRADASAVEQYHSIEGALVQIVACATTFLSLTAEGKVYSWGDPRHCSLGRAISHGCPPEVPGLIERLRDKQIDKVVCGGWMSAALILDGSLWIWGCGTPGTDRTILCLRQSDGERKSNKGGLIQVIIPDGRNRILDVAIGSNHIAAVSSQHELWVCGSNQFGQLGLGPGSPDWVDDWTKVPRLDSVRQVVCGSQSTFVYLQDLVAPS